jgi:hypothetical protein
MEIIGPFKVIGLWMMIIATIMVIIYTFRKLIRSRLTTYEKVGWTITIIIFQVLGIIAFLIYHNYYLSPDKRG